MTPAIVAPMCAYTLLLFVVWSLLGYVRVSRAANDRLRSVRTCEYPESSDSAGAAIAASWRRQRSRKRATSAALARRSSSGSQTRS